MSGKKKKKGHKFRNALAKEVLAIFYRSGKKPLNYKQVASALDVQDDLTRNTIADVLTELAKKGNLKEVQKGKYQLGSTRSYYIGTVDVTTSGAAFIISEDSEDDIFVAPKNLKHALNGDQVKVFVYARRKRKNPEGEVVEVIKRKKSEYVGLIEVSQRFAFLLPDDRKMYTDIFIPLDSLNGARDGDKAIVKITEWPKDATSPIGEVTNVLGTPGDTNVEMFSILAEFGFPVSFPPHVEEEARNIPTEITKEEISRRKDFRNITTFTIDPRDAKDFDDALSIQKLANGNYEIGVHIADVSHYVKEGGTIDKEAVERATSVYLVDRVIPMLPEVLSNEVCSLRPHEEKLCFSAVFEMDENARVVKNWVGKTVILSDRRFTYEEVQEILEKREGEYHDELNRLNDFAQTLRSKRMLSGSIAFEKIEVGFNLNEKGLPESVYFKEQKDAHKLIEEFMLMANRIVAENIGKKKSNEDKVKTFLYRIHDKPNPEKLTAFSSFISKFGYKMQTENHKKLSQSFNKLLKEVKGKREENMIEHLAIRTMAKAIYSTDNIGHYGLNFDHYSHFTSPIRRYPDVIAHRLLEKYAKGGSSANKEKIEELCEHSSNMERQAVEAERESTKLFQVIFLKDKEGEEFDGVITGVSEWGIFVEIVENKCEGMIRLKDLEDDYYTYDEENHRVTGKSSGRIFQLGDDIRILIKKADLHNKRLDFAVADD